MTDREREELRRAEREKVKDEMRKFRENQAEIAKARDIKRMEDKQVIDQWEQLQGDQLNMAVFFSHKEHGHL